MFRVEDRIRILCSQLLATKGDEESELIIIELREALHQHIERLRARLADYPIVVERRVRNGIPPSGMTTPQNAVNKDRPKSAGLKTSTNEGLP